MLRYINADKIKNHGGLNDIIHKRHCGVNQVIRCNREKRTDCLCTMPDMCKKIEPARRQPIQAQAKK